MEEIAVIGATGFVWAAITNEALDRGYKVTALVRDVSKLPVRENLTGHSVDVTDTDSLIRIFRKFDTVISAYNPGWDNPDIYADTLAGYRSILLAANEARLARLLIVGGAGSLYVEPGKMLMDTGAILEKILPGVKALAQVYIEMLPEEKQTYWVFFFPAATMKHGRRTGDYRVGRDDLLIDVKGDSVISVEDYAKEMIDEAQNRSHHRERFTIGYHQVPPGLMNI